MPKYVLGVDIGGTKIQTGLVNNQFRVINSRQSQMKKKTKQQTLDSIFQSIKYYNPDTIKSIGLSITGLVDHKKGIIISSPNLPKSFHHIPLARLIKNKFKKPTFIENDGHCIALAEALVGAGKNNGIVFSLTLGTGVGSGLIINKQIYTGAKGIIEYGHIFISEEKQKCNCGLFGHLESFVCGDGISKTYKKISGQQKKSYDIIEDAQGGDPNAKKTILMTSEYLSMGLANAINLYNPHIIILGGGLAKINIITKPAIKKIANYLSEAKYKKTKIKISQLGYDAGVLGAALLTRYNKY